MYYICTSHGHGLCGGLFRDFPRISVSSAQIRLRSAQANLTFILLFSRDCFSVKLHALDIYEIACRLDLVHLKDACLPEVVKQYNPSDPYALAAQVGMSNARPIVGPHNCATRDYTQLVISARC